MPTMNISLTAELASFVEREVSTGRYASASELVRAGLRSMERERAIEDEKQAMLRAAVQAGLGQADAGVFSSRSIEEIAQSVLAERLPHR